MKLVIKTASLLTAFFLASGCASTFQQREVETSGFLKDYPHLSASGDENNALLSFINRDAHFATYSKIMLDPIVAYAKDKDSDMASLDPEKRKDLVNYFDAALREQLKKDYTLVDKPGPGVMRIRIAITEAAGAKVFLDTVSSIVPIGLALSSIKAGATGSHMNVGSVGVECEGLDTETGVRLFAAVDARAGRKFTLQFDKFSKWRTAEDSFDFWADQLATKLKKAKAAQP